MHHVRLVAIGVARGGDDAHAVPDGGVAGQELVTRAWELGDAPVWDGVRVIPTPGHTDGHQGLVVETRQGRVVLAGQAFNTASDYARARLAQELAAAGYPSIADASAAAAAPWMDVVQALDPWRVLFAHDLATWERTEPIPPPA